MQSYRNVLNAIISGSSGKDEISLATEEGKHMTRKILNAAELRGDIVETEKGYSLSEKGLSFLDMGGEYDKLFKELPKNVKLEHCIRMMDAVGHSKGLIASRILRKTNFGTYVFKDVLNFLINKGYLGAREPDKGDYFKGKVGKIYFNENEGLEFLGRWHRYDNNFKVEAL